MYELLSPETVSPEAALERCRSALGRRWKRFGLAYALLPRAERDDLVALFAWHELVRECVERAGDETALENTLEQLRLAVDQAARGSAESAIAAALSPTVRRHQISALSFSGVLDEYARGHLVRTFETRGELLRHVRRLARPEARMLLKVAGLDSERDELLADSLAVALQLTAWLRRLAPDFERGRLHVAVEDLSRSGVDILSLQYSVASDGMARVVRDYVDWAREHFAKGWPLCLELGRWRGRLLAFVLRWHAASLSSIEAAGYDLTRAKPEGGSLRLAACLGSAAVRRASPL